MKDKPLLLDLGCGRNKLESEVFSVIGVDAWEKSDADIRASCLHLPLKTGCVDRIYTRHVLEHFAYEDLIKIFAECRRVLKEGGKMEIIVPHCSCVSAFLDPTHRTFFARRTFFKFCPFGFRVEQVEFRWFREPYTGRFPLAIRFVNSVINRLQSLERFFVLIGGVYEVRCVLANDGFAVDPSHIDGARLLK